MSYYGPAGCRAIPAGVEAGLNQISVTFNINIDTSVGWVYTVPSSFLRLETQRVSWTTTKTFTRVPFLFTQLGLLVDSGSGGVPVGGWPSTPLGATEYSLYRFCKDPIFGNSVALACAAKDLGVTNPTVTYSGSGALLDADFSRYLPAGAWTGTTANNFVRIYVPPPTPPGQPATVVDTSPINLDFNVAMKCNPLNRVGEIGLGDNEVQFDGWIQGTATGPSGKGVSFTEGTGLTAAVGIKNYTLKRALDDGVDVGGVISLSRPEPDQLDGADSIYIDRWIYDGTITIAVT